MEKCDSIQALSMLFYINSSILAVSMIWNSHIAEIFIFYVIFASAEWINFCLLRDMVFYLDF